MPIDSQIKELETAVESLVAKYESVKSKISWGNVSYILYSDYFEIANFQVDSLQSVTYLNNLDKYRDCIILLRTIFENYLMFILITKGKLYPRFFTKNKGEKLPEAIDRANKEIEDYKLKTGDNKVKKAQKSKLFKDGFEVIYEGPYIDGKKGKGQLVPFYYSVFEKFDPTTAFLNESDYFNYLAIYPKLNQKHLAEKSAHLGLYKNFLTFNSILYALRLNRIINEKEEKRARAHYCFLSKSVHASRSGISYINPLRQFGFIDSLKEINQPNKTLKLLIMLYAGYLASGYIETALDVVQNAPKRYIKKIESQAIKKEVLEFYNKYNYFWFIFNKPHGYDKFQQCVKNIGKKRYKNFLDVQDKEVSFKKEILGRMSELQSGMLNTICGVYKPPF